MDLFISWSGERSRQVALLLKSWIPDVLQCVKPWMSEDAIQSGDRWQLAIANVLEDLNYGIVCLTPENLRKPGPWMLFESGALAKSVDLGHLCPYLIDFDEVHELPRGPYAQFQCAHATYDGTYKLVRAINAATDGAASLIESRLKRTFDAHWPRLEGQLYEITKQIPRDADASDEVISTTEQVYQLLQALNGFDSVLGRFSRRVPAIIHSLEKAPVSAGAGLERLTKILSSVAGSVAGQSELDRLLDIIVEQLTELLGFEVCSIFLTDENDPDVIQCCAGAGHAKAIVGIARYRKGEGFTGSVFEKGETLLVRSRDELKGMQWSGKHDGIQWKAFDGKSQFRNMIACPLKIANSTIGLIKVENKRSGDITPHDQSILEAITNGVISVAIQNARMHERSRVQAAPLDVFAEIIAAATENADVSALCQKIASVMLERLNAEVCSVFIERERPGIIECVAGAGFAEGLVGVAEYEKGEGLTGLVYEKGHVIKLDGPGKVESLQNTPNWSGKYDHAQWKEGHQCKSLISVPLMYRGECLGVLKAENKKTSPYHFTAEDEAVLRTVAGIISLAVKGAMNVKAGASRSNKSRPKTPRQSKKRSKRSG